MRRSDAGRALRECSYLALSERYLFLVLLEQSDNADCALPAWVRPTIAELAGWTHLGRSTVIRALDHLQTHGWLTVERGGGRGHRSVYRLMPAGVDLLCTCERVPRVDPFGRSNGPVAGPIEGVKGPAMTHKGSRCDTQRVPNRGEIAGLTSENPQGIAGKREGVPTHRCDYHPDAPALLDQRTGSYRCQRCAPHLWKESA